MLKTLIKKQLYEDFRGFVYDAKKNKPRSRNNTIGLIVLFILLTVGVFGGTATALSIAICKSLYMANVSWLYFLLSSGVAIIFGIFGSVLNTYSCLYGSKDNDLLLSMPIPIKYIVFSRLINVYLMGALYSVIIILPSIIVYWAVAGITFATFVTNILLIIIITLIVLILSCILGFIVAKVSNKVKNKSFVSVLLTLLIIGVYYIAYFKASDLIKDLIDNASMYGEKIQGSAKGLYYLGQIGEGNIVSAIVTTLIVAVITLLTFILLKSTFLTIATTTGKTKSVKHKDKPIKCKSVFATLLSKEFSKFFSSANYMVNCGFGLILIPILGIVILIKGNAFFTTLDTALQGITGAKTMIVCAIIFSLNSMNTYASPSVSLEGKNIWLLQSAPIEPKIILRAKLTMHLILSIIPILFALICVMIVLDESAVVKAMVSIMILIHTLATSIFAMFMGIKMPILSWTKEIVPIKQSASVAITMFGGWAITAVFAVIYFLLAYKIGIIAYASIWIAILIILSVVLFRYIDTKGAKLFANL